MAIMPVWFVIVVLCAGVFAAGVIGVTAATRRFGPILWTIAPFVVLLLYVLGFVRTSHTPATVRVAAVTPPRAVSSAAPRREPPAARLETIESERAASATAANAAPEGAADSLAASPAASTPVTIAEFVGSDPTGQRLTAAPAWVDEPRADTGAPDQLMVVLVSARYASVEEAEEELLQQARPLVGSFLQRDGFDLPVSGLTRQELFSSGAVTRRLHEEFQVQTRSHTEPVYRVTWQLWLRPAVAQSLASTYVPRLMQERPWMLAAGLGALTLLFGSWGAFYHLNESTLGRYRGRLAVAASGLSLLAGLIAVRLFV